MAIRSCVTAVIVLCLIATVRAAEDSPIESATLDPDELRISAVERARSGDYATSIEILKGLHANRPQDVRTLHDLVIILGWAERDKDVVLLAESVNAATAPVSVLETIAKSARNERQYDLSIRWYRFAIDSYPKRLESRIGLALANADLGQAATAHKVLDEIPITDENRTRIAMTRAYVYRSDREYIKELAAYDEILEMSPNERQALRGKAQAMQRLLMPQQALELASRHPEIFSEEEIGQLRTDWAAVQVRWANQMAVPESIEDHPLDQALLEISQTGSEFGNSEAVRLRTRFDRITALRSRRRMAEAVAEFEQLDMPLEDIPGYVLGAAAGSYLYLRQPKRALELLQEALRRDPQNFRHNHDLFYVYVDLERYREAQELAERLRASEPVWKRAPGSRVIKENPRRMQAEITAGLSLAFADQLPESQERFEDLLSRAPHNTDVRMELAGVFRQRGWTDRAVQEYQQILSVEPDLVGADVGHVHALIDQREYEIAQRRIATLVSTKPQREDVLRLQRRWELHNRHYYSVNSSFGESSGSQFGNEQYQLDGYYRARPLAYRVRPFAHVHQAFAEFPEGDSTRRRLGAGIEYGGVDWIGSVELSGSRDGAGEPGISGQLEWFANDAFSVAAVAETQSNTVPLRGYRVGVDVDRAGLRLSYRANESRQLSLSGDLMQFSDGNTRNSWLLYGSQRVVTTARYKLNLDAEVFASNSSKTGVAYFNPSRDASAMLTAANTWRVYRRYDFAITQQLNAGYGVYQQESFGSNSVGFLQYLAIVDVNDGLDFRAGVRRARNVYDGQVEYGTFFTVGIGGSF